MTAKSLCAQIGRSCHAAVLQKCITHQTALLDCWTIGKSVGSKAVLLEIEVLTLYSKDTMCRQCFCSWTFVQFWLAYNTSQEIVPGQL